MAGQCLLSVHVDQDVLDDFLARIAEANETAGADDEIGLGAAVQMALESFCVMHEATPTEPRTEPWVDQDEAGNATLLVPCLTRRQAALVAALPPGAIQEAVWSSLAKTAEALER